MQTINWKRDLGSPTTPGKYRVKGLGEVDISQEQIDEAQAMGGEPDVEVHDVTAFGDKMRQYLLGRFVP